MTDMMKAIHPIAYHCYYSGEEFGGVAVEYFTTIQDGKKIFYNVIYHTGDIYDDSAELYYMIKNWDNSNDTWSRLGFLAGNIINRVLYKPTDYNPFDPKKKPSKKSRTFM